MTWYVSALKIDSPRPTFTCIAIFAREPRTFSQASILRDVLHSFDMYQKPRPWKSEETSTAATAERPQEPLPKTKTATPAQAGVWNWEDNPAIGSHFGRFGRDNITKPINLPSWWMSWPLVSHRKFDSMCEWGVLQEERCFVLGCLWFPLIASGDLPHSKPLQRPRKSRCHQWLDQKWYVPVPLPR